MINSDEFQIFALVYLTISLGSVIMLVVISLITYFKDKHEKGAINGYFDNTNESPESNEILDQN